MCLLVHQPASTRFSDEFLVDVYSANRDGLGVMFSEGGKLHVHKVLPKTSREFVDFYRAHAEGRECVWHARMMTHGDINFDNCHPYRVTDRVYLAHNGILSTGNDWDKSRSDTWHFIRNVIGPVIEARESLLLDNEWLSFVGDLIGSGNMFGMMSADGTVAIINRKSGVTYAGAWLSNTYAWSAHRFGVASAPSRSYSSSPIWSSGYGYGLDDDELDAYSLTSSRSSWSVRSSRSSSKASRSGGDSLLKITRAARNSYERGTLAQWVQDAPSKASRLLSAIEDDPTGATGERVYKNPDWVVECIGEYFDAEASGFQ
ncbi:MAG: hypothetical protein ACO32H_08290 [Steroidobacteraceae bacterium]